MSDGSDNPLVPIVLRLDRPAAILSSELQRAIDRVSFGLRAGELLNRVFAKFVREVATDPEIRRALTR